jgi:hypothetical protein
MKSDKKQPPIEHGLSICCEVAHPNEEVIYCFWPKIIATAL